MGRWLVIILVMMLAGFVSASRAQSVDESLSVTDPRPLAEAVRLVEHRCGCRVTYEDPVFAERDTIDMSRSRGSQGSRRLLIPAGGLFTFSMRIAQGDDNPERVAEALRAVVETYSRTGYPGAFRVTTTGGIFHVAPEQSVLDTPVTISLEQVSASQAIDSILAAVQKATGETIGGGGIVSNGLRQQRVSIAIVERPAREALIDVFTQIQNPVLNRLSWRLLYQIGWGYSLNLHNVPE